jgi:choice-of-anchor A domain-containing protein
MKILLIALLCIGLSLQQATNTTCQFPPVFGNIPSLYNVFLFNEFFSQENITIGGRLAANNSITLGHGAAVATQLPASLCAPNTTTPGLTAASLNASESNWFYNVVSGGTVNWTNGTLGSGTIVSGSNESISGIDNPHCPGFHLLVLPGFIDFTFWQQHLLDVSEKMARLGEENGTKNGTLQNGTLIFPLSINDLAQTNTAASSPDGLENVQVFNVQASDLLQTTRIQFGNVSSNETAASSNETLKTVIINVIGSPCGWAHDVEGAEDLERFASKIIWNFENCTSMQINNVSSIPGTILAPHAAVVADDPKGELYGHLFAESFNGSLTFINVKFDGCFLLPNASVTPSSGATTPVGTSVTPGTTPAKRNMDFVIDVTPQEHNTATSMTVSIMAAALALLIAAVF